MQQLEMDFETGVWKELTPETVFYKGRYYVFRTLSGENSSSTRYSSQLYQPTYNVNGLRVGRPFTQYLELPA